MANIDVAVIPKIKIELGQTILNYSEVKIKQNELSAECLNSIKQWAIEIQENCNTQLKAMKEKTTTEQ